MLVLRQEDCWGFLPVIWDEPGKMETAHSGDVKGSGLPPWESCLITSRPLEVALKQQKGTLSPCAQGALPPRSSRERSFLP